MNKDGERGRNRTYNLLIKSQLLCQLSYAPAEAMGVGQGVGADLRPLFNVTRTLRQRRSCISGHAIAFMLTHFFLKGVYSSRSSPEAIDLVARQVHFLRQAIQEILSTANW